MLLRSFDAFNWIQRKMNSTEILDFFVIYEVLRKNKHCVYTKLDINAVHIKNV